MSEQVPVSGPTPEFPKVFLPELKDRAIAIGWIAGLIIIGSLAWILCRPLLSTYLQRSVNLSMTAAGVNLRITALNSPQPVKYAPMGMWYSINGSPDLFFVFPVFQDGIMSVLGARLTPGHTVSDIIPVSAHARKIFNRLSPGLIKLHTRRIEMSAAQWRKND